MKQANFKTHILFTEGLQLGNSTDFNVKPITEKWHLTCNNFTGTLEECTEEGNKMKVKAEKFFSERNVFVEPHYPNAPLRVYF